MLVCGAAIRTCWLPPPRFIVSRQSTPFDIHICVSECGDCPARSERTGPVCPQICLHARNKQISAGLGQISVKCQPRWNKNKPRSRRWSPRASPWMKSKKHLASRLPQRNPADRDSRAWLTGDDLLSRRLLASRNWCMATKHVSELIATSCWRCPQSLTQTLVEFRCRYPQLWMRAAHRCERLRLALEAGIPSRVVRNCLGRVGLEGRQRRSGIFRVPPE